MACQNTELQCQKCGSLHDSVDARDEHTQTCPGPNPLQCPLCFKQFAQNREKCTHITLKLCGIEPIYLNDEKKLVLTQYRLKDGYVNVSELCKRGNKKWEKFITSSAGQDAIKRLQEQLPGVQLVEDEAPGKDAWVHPQLAIVVAIWSDCAFAGRVQAAVSPIYPIDTSSTGVKTLVGPDGKNITQIRMIDGYVNSAMMCKATKKVWAEYRRSALGSHAAAEILRSTGNKLLELIRDKSRYGTWVHPDMGISLGSYCGDEAFATMVKDFIDEHRIDKDVPRIEKPLVEVRADGYVNASEMLNKLKNRCWAHFMRRKVTERTIDVLMKAGVTDCIQTNENGFLGTWVCPDLGQVLVEYVGPEHTRFYEELKAKMANGGNENGPSGGFEEDDMEEQTDDEGEDDDGEEEWIEEAAEAVELDVIGEEEADNVDEADDGSDDKGEVDEEDEVNDVEELEDTNKLDEAGEQDDADGHCRAEHAVLDELIGELVDIEDLFPVNVDDVWKKIGYTTKGNAKKALSTQFQEGIDFIVTAGGKKRSDGSETRGGHNKQTIMLTKSCENQLALAYAVMGRRDIKKVTNIPVQYVKRFLPKETEILDFVKRMCVADYPCDRSYHIDGYFIDLYFPAERIAIECDEHGHQRYSQENEHVRQAHIECALNCKFIRFNPDAPDFDLAVLLRIIWHELTAARAMTRIHELSLAKEVTNQKLADKATAEANSKSAETSAIAAEVERERIMAQVDPELYKQFMRKKLGLV